MQAHLAFFTTDSVRAFGGELETAVEGAFSRLLQRSRAGAAAGVSAAGTGQIEAGRSTGGHLDVDRSVDGHLDDGGSAGGHLDVDRSADGNFGDGGSAGGKLQGIERLAAVGQAEVDDRLADGLTVVGLARCWTAGSVC